MLNIEATYDYQSIILASVFIAIGVVVVILFFFRKDFNWYRAVESRSFVIPILLIMASSVCLFYQFIWVLNIEYFSLITNYFFLILFSIAFTLLISCIQYLSQFFEKNQFILTSQALNQNIHENEVSKSKQRIMSYEVDLSFLQSFEKDLDPSFNMTAERIEFKNNEEDREIYYSTNRRNKYIVQVEQFDRYPVPETPDSYSEHIYAKDGDRQVKIYEYAFRAFEKANFLELEKRDLGFIKDLIITEIQDLEKRIEYEFRICNLTPRVPFKLVFYNNLAQLLAISLIGLIPNSRLLRTTSIVFGLYKFLTLGSFLMIILTQFSSN